METVQGLNLNRRYIFGLEPEMPVTLVTALRGKWTWLIWLHISFPLN